MVNIYMIFTLKQNLNMHNIKHTFEKSIVIAWYKFTHDTLLI